MFDFICGNCKHRTTWECEDYHHWYYNTSPCKTGFELDPQTLSKAQKEEIINMFHIIKKEG